MTAPTLHFNSNRKGGNNLEQTQRPRTLLHEAEPGAVHRPGGAAVWPVPNPFWILHGYPREHLPRLYHHHGLPLRPDHRLHRLGGHRGRLPKRGPCHHHRHADGHLLQSALHRHAHRQHLHVRRVCPIREKHPQHLAHLSGGIPLFPLQGGTLWQTFAPGLFRHCSGAPGLGSRHDLLRLPPHYPDFGRCGGGDRLRVYPAPSLHPYLQISQGV